MRIEFTRRDLLLFRQASGDKNPLHSSETYARETSFGEPVVYGVLGVLASLGALSSEEQSTISDIAADFHRPMFQNTGLELRTNVDEGTRMLRLLDSGSPVLTLTVRFSARTQDPVDVTGTTEALFPDDSPRTLSWGDLAFNQICSGQYRVDREARQRLAERWGIEACRPALLDVLLWASYFIGMEMPGEQALFSNLRMSFVDIGSRSPTLFYQARIERLNAAFEQLHLQVTLRRDDGEPVSQGKLSAFVRRKLSSGRRRDSADRIEGTPLVGRTVLIVGGSRGFGSSLAVACAEAGANVISLSRSAKEAPGEWSNTAGTIEIAAIDAGDIRSIRELAESLDAQGRRIDYLVCNASPPLQSIRLHPESLGRVQKFLVRAMDLVLVPTMTLLPLLQKASGCIVLVSSSVVEEPVREWPHYNAAKAAMEAALRVLPMQHPELSVLVVRPTSMRTEMTNTPGGRVGAKDPYDFAEGVLQQMIDRPMPGECRTRSADQLLASREHVLL